MKALHCITIVAISSAIAVLAVGVAVLVSSFQRKTDDLQLQRLHNEIQKIAERLSAYEAGTSVPEATTTLTPTSETTQPQDCTDCADRLSTYEAGIPAIQTTTALEPTTTTLTPTSETTQPQDCADCVGCAEHYSRGKRHDGVYRIYPDGKPVDVYCQDMQSGGSIVIQKRYDGSLNFTKTFEEYSKGFGKLDGQHWLGLSHVHGITATGTWTLRIDLESFENETRYAEYSDFSIGASPGYELLFNKTSYRGDAGNKYGLDLSFHHGCKFSTYDRDQDRKSGVNCATMWYGGGGFWYNGDGIDGCAFVITTGMPYEREDQAIKWSPWKWYTSLKSVTLRIIKQN